jgi:hypothetical protein
MVRDPVKRGSGAEVSRVLRCSSRFARLADPCRWGYGRPPVAAAEAPV